MCVPVCENMHTRVIVDMCEELCVRTCVKMCVFLWLYLFVLLNGGCLMGPGKNHRARGFHGS